MGGGAVGGTTGKKSKPVSLNSDKEVILDILQSNINKESIKENKEEIIRIMEMSESHTLEPMITISPEQAWDEMTKNKMTTENGETIIGPWSIQEAKRWGIIIADE